MKYVCMQGDSYFDLIWMDIYKSTFASHSVSYCIDLNVCKLKPTLFATHIVVKLGKNVMRIYRQLAQVT